MTTTHPSPAGVNPPHPSHHTITYYLLAVLVNKKNQRAVVGFDTQPRHAAMQEIREWTRVRFLGFLPHRSFVQSQQETTSKDLDQPKQTPLPFKRRQLNPTASLYNTTPQTLLRTGRFCHAPTRPMADSPPPDHDQDRQQDICDSLLKRFETLRSAT